MSLKAWLAKGALQAHQPSTKEIAGLLALADRNLADAGIRGLSAEGRFQFAYNAALAMATAALHAAGYRTNSNIPGHHAVTVESLQYTIGLDAVLVRKLDAYRRKRNRVSYDAPAAVSAKEAADMLALAAQLRHDVEAWIRAKHAALISR
jgi:hypothetical protein